MSFDRDEAQPGAGGLDRRKFLRNSGGMATGLAVTMVPAASVALVSPAVASAKLGVPVEPTGEMPGEPVMAYVHDAEKGEVTVLSGTSERTYRDPILAKRLLAAADAQKS